ncbi:zinc finger protein 16 isoform X3 [Echeneis naucrates]|uniref:Zinc finger protein 16-like n=1 Tax=Echeneis naucrates TaxID=173247 RepID=A0A665T8X3_ECHNA|nr:zinc finger protein 16-like isoform X3 [Echeneis naucrates]
MDGGAPAAITEDGAGQRPLRGHPAAEDTDGPSAEDPPTDPQQCSIVCKDCGLRFTHWQVFKTHLHQHAMEEEEEEEDNRMGGNKNSAAEPNHVQEDGEKDKVVSVDGCDTSSSSKTNPSDTIESISMKKPQRGYSCQVCGKLYTYLSSFQKHQELHERRPSMTEDQSVENLNKYECPDCGVSFIRRTRLLSHMRVHRSSRKQKPKPPRCDQCNKDFTSTKSWMNHNEMHKEKTFWCLSCAKGFRDDVSLDKHLQNHSLKQHKCSICQKRFQTAGQLISHYNTHTGAKPYQCSFCGKNFSDAVNLIIHRERHLSISSKNLGIFSTKQVFRKSVEEELEMGGNKEEPLEIEIGKKIARVENQENPASGSNLNPDDSDCGEPIHRITGMSSSNPLDESKLETVRQQAERDQDQRKHKYWEWECFECDMGFDDLAKLHLHYIQHATGEVPFLQDNIE